MIEEIKLNKSTITGDTSTLFKRARAKFFTLGLIFPLLNLDSPLKKSYWNTYHCAAQLTENKSQGKITSKYCKNRWCLVCNRIRTAINIKKYMGEVSAWGENKYFVTLTKPTVSASELSDNIEELFDNFKLCVRAIQRTHKLKFKAIRKLECTYNPNDDKYHAHFHCIVYGKSVAELLKKEWLKRYPAALDYLQDVRECDNDSLLELFKYFTKVITPGKSKKKSKLDNGAQIYINSLDIIFQAIYNKRTFQHYGFTCPDIDDKDFEDINLKDIDEDEKEIDELEFWLWDPNSKITDWVNKKTGELLTGYEPSDALSSLLDKLKLNNMNSS